MGNVVLLGIRAETNLSFANVDAAGLPDFSRSNYSCRIYGNVGGGRGGGIAIFSRHSAPCVSRYDVFAAVQRELDHKFRWCEPTAGKYPPALSASTWANPSDAKSAANLYYACRRSQRRRLGLGLGTRRPLDSAQPKHRHFYQGRLARYFPTCVGIPRPRRRPVRRA